MPPKKTGKRLAQKKARLDKLRASRKSAKKPRQPVKCPICHQSKKHSHRTLNEQGKEVHKCSEKDRCTSFDLCKYEAGHADELLEREIAVLEKQMEQEQHEEVT